ncbi:MAG: hypothetical protein JSS64_04020, partial [Bacteroidetes bacterium]|nr:hypothetical protein [Bacteroidota bacterium]
PILFVLLMGVVNSVHTIAQSVNNQFPDSLTVNSSRPFHLKAQDYVAKLAMQSPQDSSEGGYLHSLTRHIDYVNNRISSNTPIGTPLSQAWKSGNGSPMVGDITPFPQEEVSSNTTRSNDPYIQIGIRITNDAIRAIQNFTVSQTVIYKPRNGQLIELLR